MTLRVLKPKQAQAMGYVRDRRKRRSQHRTNAAYLMNGGTFMNARAPKGSIPYDVAQWHLWQARHLR